MLEDRLQKYLKESATLSPSHYIEEPFLKRFKDRARLALRYFRNVKQRAQKDAVLDKESSDFIKSLGRSRDKYLPLDSALESFDNTNNLLPKLGYDRKLHQLESIAGTLIERLGRESRLYANASIFDIAVQLADRANALNQQHGVGIDVVHGAYGSVIDALIKESRLYANASIFDIAVQLADKAHEINQKYQVGKDQALRNLYVRLQPKSNVVSLRPQN